MITYKGSYAGHADFDAESSKGDGTVYSVTLKDDGTGVCTCPSFVHRQTECKHIKEARECMEFMQGDK